MYLHTPTKHLEHKTFLPILCTNQKIIWKNDDSMTVPFPVQFLLRKNEPCSMFIHAKLVVKCWKSNKRIKLAELVQSKFPYFLHLIYISAAELFFPWSNVLHSGRVQCTLTHLISSLCSMYRSSFPCISPDQHEKMLQKLENGHGRALQPRVLLPFHYFCYYNRPWSYYRLLQIAEYRISNPYTHAILSFSHSSRLRTYFLFRDSRKG